MKLKQLPEDFQVEELTDVSPGASGPFGFYRLQKQGWTTLDALDVVRRRWRIEGRWLSYAGLKDRHADTVQYFSLVRGPQRNLTHQRLTVQYLGRLYEPYTPRSMLGNRFKITLRDIAPAEAESVRETVDEIRKDGVPNYFDDQRFGSVGEAHEFVAHALIVGDYEKALRLALATPYAHDRAAQKKEKAVLAECWGDWAACKSRLPRGHARSIVDYLVHHPDGFRGAAARLRPELRSLYLSAFQSYLWNRILAEEIRAACDAEQVLRIDTRLGPVPMYRALRPEQHDSLVRLAIPLPSARLKVPADDPLRASFDRALVPEGLRLED